MEQHANRHGHGASLASLSANSHNNHAAVAAAAQAAAAQAAAAAAVAAASNPAAAAPQQLPLIPHIPTSVAAAVLPQQMITAGTKKDCIRLRGLPYEAQVENILEFLGDHAKNIRFQGVHMVYNAQVK